ncbi:MAG: SDR family NAD(P)-dependent oxidoreductase [Bacteroidota bacterium]
MRKTILITGSTDGIGKLAAIKLAKSDHKLYLHGRNPDKLSATISEIVTTTNNQNIDGFVADFSNLDQVSTMAHQINDRVSTLDVLINNAGVYKSARTNNENSLDLRFVVNYLAPYKLTLELLPLLRASAARVINLSSAAQAPVSLNALRGEKQIPTHSSYAQSKLALSMWSAHLAKTEPQLNVIAVNPGSLLNTNMVREGFGFHQASADVGAKILYDLAISDQYKNDSGKYFDNDRGGFGQIHPSGQEQTHIDELLRETTRLVGVA